MKIDGTIATLHCISSLPCGIISFEGWYPMSIVASVCGVNFTMMAADRRLVSLDQRGYIKRVQSDDFHKIFRLNERMLFAVTGQIAPGEGLLDPFKSLCHPETMTMRMAAKALERYVAENISPTQKYTRQYILSGRDNKGRFCTYVLSSYHNFQPEWITPDQGQFCVKILGPRGFLNDDSLAQTYIYNTMPWGTDTALREHLADFIRAYAKVEPSVGGEPEILILT